MTDTYHHWMERVAGGRNAKPLSTGEVVKSSSAEPFVAVEFVRIPKAHFIANVGKKGNAYIYHFYPSARLLSGTTFEDTLADVFLELFKREDQIESEWVDEMKAWAVRVRGWTDHVWGDELALRAVDMLEEVLGERT